MCFITSIFEKLSNNQYGFVIVLISIVTRIFIVSIAWSYGVFLVALKKTYPNSFYSELGWIAGLAQGFGSIISPSYIWIIKQIGYRLTFLIGLSLCILSMIASSYTTTEHHLFFTYSLPFGIGSSLVFVLESLLVGEYFPRTSKYHVSASVAISLGFPLGFLILSPLTEALICYFDSDWRFVQRIYGFVTLFQLILFVPLFTERHADRTKDDQERRVNEEYRTWTNVYGMKASHVKIVTKLMWLFGIFSISCANNSVQINLNGFFGSLGADVAEESTYLIVIGLSDTIFRLVLAASGSKIINNLSFCYIGAAFTGILISLIWGHATSYGINLFASFVFGVCPAVTMSLMYSVNTEISGRYTDVNSEYTWNVMVSGFGIFFGPIVTGFILDTTHKSYSAVFGLAAGLYAAALCLFTVMKIILMKNAKNREHMDDYELFQSEYLAMY